MPPRLDDADTDVALDDGAVGADGAETDLHELLEIVIERVHLHLGTRCVAVDVR